MSKAKKTTNRTGKTIRTNAFATPNKVRTISKTSPAKATAQRKPSAKSRIVAPPASGRIITTETIAARAYALWEQAGRPNGRDVEYWLQAESQLKQEHSFSA